MHNHGAVQIAALETGNMECSDTAVIREKMGADCPRFGKGVFKMKRIADEYKSLLGCLSYDSISIKKDHLLKLYKAMGRDAGIKQIREDYYKNRLDIIFEDAKYESTALYCNYGDSNYPLLRYTCDDGMEYAIDWEKSIFRPEVFIEDMERECIDYIDEYFNDIWFGEDDYKDFTCRFEDYICGWLDLESTDEFVNMDVYFDKVFEKVHSRYIERRHDEMLEALECKDDGFNMEHLNRLYEISGSAPDDTIIMDEIGKDSLMYIPADGKMKMIMGYPGDQEVNILCRLDSIGGSAAAVDKDFGIYTDEIFRSRVMEFLSEYAKERGGYNLEDCIRDFCNECSGKGYHFKECDVRSDFTHASIAYDTDRIHRDDILEEDEIGS